MHPTFSQFLVTDRHATFRAEADHARLVSVARSAKPTAATSTTSGTHPARHGVVRRLVMRLGAA
jgi:hypothetical protein